MLKHKIFADKNEILDFVNLNKIRSKDIINIQKNETGYELFFFDKKGRYESEKFRENILMYAMFILLLIIVLLQMVRFI